MYKYFVVMVVILLNTVFLSACSDGRFVVQEHEAEALKPAYELAKELSIYIAQVDQISLLSGQSEGLDADDYFDPHKLLGTYQELTVKLSIAVDTVKSEKGRRVIFFYMLAQRFYSDCLYNDRHDSFLVITEFYTNAETCRKAAEDILLGRVDDYEVTHNNSGVVELR